MLIQAIPGSGASQDAPRRAIAGTCGPVARPEKQKKRAAGAMVPVLLAMAACSGTSSAPDPSPEHNAPASGLSTKATGQATEPATSLAFEWSANGFEQLPAQYTWTGTGKRDDVYQPNFSLSVPETDDVMWSSECTAGGKVKSRIYLNPPAEMVDNRASFKFETDASATTLQYTAKYVANGQYDGFEIVQSASDPMFAEMRTAKWAYVQMGDGTDAVKLRISLANARRALGAFLPACAIRPQRNSAATAPAIRYSCAGGHSVRATYLGHDTDTPVVRLEIGEALHLLPQAVSGSGARYESSAAMGGDERYIWLTKANDGLLIERNADDTDGATEKTLICSTKPI